MSRKLTAEEYLEQVFTLECRVNRHKAECAKQKAQAYSLSAPSIGEKVSHSFNTSAPFEKAIDTSLDLNMQVAEEKKLLDELKNQVRTAIDSMDDEDEQDVLSKLYLSYCWQKEVAADLKVNRTTIYRKKKSALEHFVVPENPIII